MNYRDRDPVDYERSARSVFVGNIPYEATEEQLKDIFAEVGPVLSFRLVFDRESGKPKGYGFAEYQDQETALSAMRNLNSRELHGRTLRVDHATSEKNKIMDEFNGVGNLPPPPENPYGEAVPSKDAPEAISRAVASLPPEQMFELMKQMKNNFSANQSSPEIMKQNYVETEYIYIATSGRRAWMGRKVAQCIQNNPVEARNMLLQNPQLAYALLQAQVVMRIVDPEIAMKMLHRQNPVQPILPPSGPSEPQPMDGRPNGAPMPPGPFGRDHRDPGIIPRRRDGSPIDRMDIRGPLPLDRGPSIHRLEPGRGPPDDRLDHIPIDQRRPEPIGPGIDRNRGPPMGPYRGPPRRSPEPFNRDQFGRPDVREPNFHERPREARGPPIDNRNMPMNEIRDQPRIPEQRGSSLERGAPIDRGPPPLGGAGDPRRPVPISLPPRSLPGPPPPLGGNIPDLSNNPDQEKAALIMQVLQLTPEQIAMLPEEQRKSILILKEQITGGRQ